MTFVKSYFQKFFLNPSHICFFLTALEKSLSLTVPGSWPLCYSWIGYLQANGPPTSSTIYKRGSQYFMCAHRRNADNSDLSVTTALFQCCQIVFLLSLAENSCSMLLFLLGCLFIIGSWLSGACRHSGAMHP